MTIFGKEHSVVSRLQVGTMAAVLGFAVTAPAMAALKEVTLATPAQALAYCKAGKMMPNDIAYFAGAGGLAQYGDTNCTQQIPKGSVKLALAVKGKSKVSECTMGSVAQGLKFCESGAMGQYDIDYIGGKVGRTISGPGYGCVANYSSVSLGNAICK